MTANKKSGPYPDPTVTPSRELNPLAAGTQTSSEKGDDAYDPNDMNRHPNSTACLINRQTIE